MYVFVVLVLALNLCKAPPQEKAAKVEKPKMTSFFSDMQAINSAAHSTEGLGQTLWRGLSVALHFELVILLYNAQSV